MKFKLLKALSYVDAILAGVFIYPVVKRLPNSNGG